MAASGIGVKRADQYANVAYATITMSAANTLTFSQISMAVGLFQGVALLLHRILWHPPLATCREMVAATDNFAVALTSSNRLSSLQDITDPAIIARIEAIGIGVAVEKWLTPLVTDFTGLPGGGKLVPANPLFIGMSTNGFAAAGICRAQLDFTMLELGDKDYLELIQAIFPVNIT